jgi:hypothetical protein
MIKKSRHLQVSERARTAGSEPVEGALELADDSGDPIARLRGTGGVVFVEYVALLSLVTVVGAGAVVALGIPLMKLFRYQELLLSLPIP